MIEEGTTLVHYLVLAGGFFDALVWREAEASSVRIDWAWTSPCARWRLVLSSRQV